MKKLLILLTCILCLQTAFAANNIMDDDNLLSEYERTSIDKMINYIFGFYSDAFDCSRGYIDMQIYDDCDEFRQEAVKLCGSKTAVTDTTIMAVFRNRFLFCKEGGRELDLSSIGYFLGRNFLANSYRGNPYFWVHYGFGNYFSEAYVDENQEVLMRESEWAKDRIKQFYNTGKINLKEIINKTAPHVSQTEAKFYITMSYGIVYFLMAKDKEMVKRILHALHQGKTASSVINKEYPGGFAAFEKEFAEYYSK